MRKALSIFCLAVFALARTHASPKWVPFHFTIPDRTISPDGHYGVMIPDSGEDAGASKLVEMKTGRVVATIIGANGWEGANPSMKWGQMEAIWSADSSTLCWIFPGKWFPASFVVLKLRSQTLAWQENVMKQAQAEILARTEEEAPQNFAAAKLENAGDGSAYPEGFSIDITVPAQRFSLPLTFQVSLTSDPKGSDDEPEENGVLSWLTMTVQRDGGVTFAHFEVKRGALSPEEMDKVAAAKVDYPLIDTGIGKALLFAGLESKDGRYAVGWTVRAAAKGQPPVDWSRWDPTDPDKLLRHYDWQSYDDEGESGRQYKVVDFALDRRTGKTIELPTATPCWSWKRNDGQMSVGWFEGPSGRLSGLVDNAIGDYSENFWLVTLDEKGMKEKELTAAMRSKVDQLMQERRPEIANPSDFSISYRIEKEDRSADDTESADVPFVATPRRSDKQEFGISGVVTLSLSDATTIRVSSAAKRLDPFVTNDQLREADEALTTVYRAILQWMSPPKAAVFRQKQRIWIAQRDHDAAQADNTTPYGSAFEVFERSRETSLLESTKKRIQELQGLVHR